jgi:hypothetical protein
MRAASNQTIAGLGVVKARTAAKQQVKKVLAETWTKAQVPMKQLQTLRDKLGEDHLEYTSLHADEKLSGFEPKVTRLMQLRDNTKQWTDESYSDKYVEIEGLCADIITDNVFFASAVQALKGIRLLEVQASAGARRKVALKCKQRLAGIDKQGFPKTIITWLGEKVLGLTAESTEDNFQESICNMDAANFDWHAPAISRAGRPHLFSSALDCMMPHLSPRLAKVTRRLAVDLEKNESTINMLRVPPADPPDQYFEMKWLPSQFAMRPRGEAWVVEDIVKHGTPWVLHHAPVGFRYGIECFPFANMACFLQCITGPMAIVTWPLIAVKDLGGQLDQTIASLESMASPEASSWMTANVNYAVLSVGDTVWIPYGFEVFLINVADGGSSMLHQPIFSKAALAATVKNKDLRKYILGSVGTIVQNNIDGMPWKVIGKGVTSWIKSAASLT